MIKFVCRIEVYDWDADGGHDFIGDCTTNLEELAEGEGFQIVQVLETLVRMEGGRFQMVQVLET